MITISRNIHVSSNSPGRIILWNTARNEVSRIAASTFAEIKRQAMLYGRWGKVPDARAAGMLFEAAKAGIIEMNPDKLALDGGVKLLGESLSIKHSERRFDLIVEFSSRLITASADLKLRSWMKSPLIRSIGIHAKGDTAIRLIAERIGDIQAESEGRIYVVISKICSAQPIVWSGSARLYILIDDSISVDFVRETVRLNPNRCLLLVGAGQLSRAATLSAVVGAPISFDCRFGDDHIRSVSMEDYEAACNFTGSSSLTSACESTLHAIPAREECEAMKTVILLENGLVMFGCVRSRARRSRKLYETDLQRIITLHSKWRARVRMRTENCERCVARWGCGGACKSPLLNVCSQIRERLARLSSGAGL